MRKHRGLSRPLLATILAASLTLSPISVMAAETGQTVQSQEVDWMDSGGGGDVVPDIEFAEAEEIAALNSEEVSGNSQAVSGNSQAVSGNSQEVGDNSQEISDNSQVLSSDSQVMSQEEKPQRSVLSEETVTQESPSYTEGEKMVLDTDNVRYVFHTGNDSNKRTLKEFNGEYEGVIKLDNGYDAAFSSLQSSSSTDSLAVRMYWWALSPVEGEVGAYEMRAQGDDTVPSGSLPQKGNRGGWPIYAPYKYYRGGDSNWVTSRGVPFTANEKYPEYSSIAQIEFRYMGEVEEGVSNKYYVAIVTKGAAGTDAGKTLYLSTEPGTDSKAKWVELQSNDVPGEDGKWIMEEAPDFVNAAGDDRTMLYRTSPMEYHYRIPALATANNGDLIAISDYRFWSSSDIGTNWTDYDGEQFRSYSYGHQIDLHSRISSDDGKTWEKATNVTEGLSKAPDVENKIYGNGYGDAAIVADRHSDSVLMMSVSGFKGYNQVGSETSYTVSHDNGKQFGDWVQISDQMYGRFNQNDEENREPLLNGQNLTQFFVGSGRIHQSRYVKVGSHYRIYAAILVNREGKNYVLYSDDFGENWYILGNQPAITSGGDEAKVEELPDGSVIISSRKSSNPKNGRLVNVFTYMDKSKYTTGTWDTQQHLSLASTNTNNCNGELYIIYAKKNDNNEYGYLLLQTLPSGSGREAVRIYYRWLGADATLNPTQLAQRDQWSQDGESIVLNQGNNCYSVMSWQADGKLAVVWEEDSVDYNIVYQAFTVEELTNSKYSAAFSEGIGSVGTPYVVKDEAQYNAMTQVYEKEKVYWDVQYEADASPEPTAPSMDGVQVEAASGSTATLTFPEATAQDDKEITGYNITVTEENGVEPVVDLHNQQGTSHVLSGLNKGKAYNISIVAIDNAGLVSDEVTYDYTHEASEQPVVEVSYQPRTDKDKIPSTDGLVVGTFSTTLDGVKDTGYTYEIESVQSDGKEEKESFTVETFNLRGKEVNVLKLNDDSSLTKETSCQVTVKATKMIGDEEVSASESFMVTIKPDVEKEEVYVLDTDGIDANAEYMILYKAHRDYWRVLNASGGASLTNLLTDVFNDYSVGNYGVVEPSPSFAEDTQIWIVENGDDGNYKIRLKREADNGQQYYLDLTQQSTANVKLSKQEAGGASAPQLSIRPAAVGEHGYFLSNGENNLGYGNASGNTNKWSSTTGEGCELFFFKKETVTPSTIGNMFDTDIDNIWVFTGGADVQGGFEQVQGARNYIGQFEEYIRWKRVTDGFNTRARFTFNVGKAGRTLQDIVDNWANLITVNQPRAVAYMLGVEDYGKGEEGIGSFKANLKSFIDKALAEKNGTGYVVIQYAYRTGVQAKDDNIKLYIQAIEELVEEAYLTQEKRQRILLVDHYSSSYIYDMGESKWVDAHTTGGTLNKMGHFELGRQLAAATITFNQSNRISDYPTNSAEPILGSTPVAAPAVYSNLMPTAVSAADSLYVTLDKHTIEQLQSSNPGNGWVYELTLTSPETMKKTVITGTVEATAGKPFVISGLETGAAYVLQLRTESEGVQLQSLEGKIGEGERGAAYTLDLYKEDASESQQKLAEKLKKDQPLRWLFVGDSITHASAYTNEYDGIAQLFEKYVRETLGRADDVVLNTGVANAQAEDFLYESDDTDTGTTNNEHIEPSAADISRTRLDYDADVVVLMMGTNDSAFAKTVSGYKVALETMITEIRKHNPDAIIVLRSPIYLANSSHAIQNTSVPYMVKTMETVAQEQNVEFFIDQYTPWTMALKGFPWLYDTSNGGLLYGDNVHPNEQGHLFMFRQLIDALGMEDNDSPLVDLLYDKVSESSARERLNEDLLTPNEEKKSLSLNLSEFIAQDSDAGSVTLKVIDISSGQEWETTVQMKATITKPDAESSNYADYGVEVGWADAESLVITGLPWNKPYSIDVETWSKTSMAKKRYTLNEYMVGTQGEKLTLMFEGEDSGITTKTEQQTEAGEVGTLGVYGSTGSKEEGYSFEVVSVTSNTDTDITKAAFTISGDKLNSTQALEAGTAYVVTLKATKAGDTGAAIEVTGDLLIMTTGEARQMTLSLEPESPTEVGTAAGTIVGTLKVEGASKATYSVEEVKVQTTVSGGESVSRPTGEPLFEAVGNKLKVRKNLATSTTYLVTVKATDGSATGWNTFTIVTNNIPTYPSYPDSGDSVEYPEGIWVGGIDGSIFYTGGKITQDIVVYDGETRLTEKVDYTISYKNNVKAREWPQEGDGIYVQSTGAGLQTLAVQSADGSAVHVLSGDEPTGIDEILPDTEVPSDLKKSPQVIIKMKGNYKGTHTIYFEIQPIDISYFDVDHLTVTNNGKGKKEKPMPVVTWNGKKLENKKDYTLWMDDQAYNGISTSANQETEKELVIKGTGNFTGEKRIDVKVTRAVNVVAMDKVSVRGVRTLTWTEEAKTEGMKQGPLTVKYKKDVLVEEVGDVSDGDYTIEYENGRSVGTASILLTGTGKDSNKDGTIYEGSKRINFKINGTNMSKVTVDGILKTGYAYTGDEITLNEQLENGTINVTIKKTGEKLQVGEDFADGVDYTVAYQKNVNKGTATMILTGNPAEGYTGTKKQTFKIVADTIDDDTDKPEEKFTIEITDEAKQDGDGSVVQMPFTKGGVKPEITVTDPDGDPLVLGTDYTVTYKNNKMVGAAATLTVKGKGNYTGTEDLSFSIVPKNLDDGAENEDDVTVVAKDKVFSDKRNGWKSSIKVVDQDGKALNNRDADIRGAKYTIDSLPDGTDDSNLMRLWDEETDLTTAADIDIPAGTTIRVTVDMVEGGNYSGSVEGTYRILEKGHDISKAKIKIADQVYTGKEVLIDENKDFNGTPTLTISKDNVVEMYLEDADDIPENEKPTMKVVPGSYVKNVNKGTAKVTFQGIGEYGGTKTVSFKIGQRSILDNFIGLFDVIFGNG